MAAYKHFLVNCRNEFLECARDPDSSFTVMTCKYVRKQEFATHFMQLAHDASAEPPPIVVMGQVFDCCGFSVGGAGPEWQAVKGTEYECSIIMGPERAVNRFCSLAEVAGAALPIELRPSKAFHEFSSPAEKNGFDNVGEWIGFVFRLLFENGMSAAFLFTKDVPSPGCVIAKLRMCPFRASVLAIDLDASVQREDHEGRWLTVSDAETISGINRGVISRAVDKGKLKSNAKSGRARRIDLVDFTRWQLERANNPERRESEAAIGRKLES